MNPSTSRSNGRGYPDDATLVAWLDDELPAATAASIARSVQADRELAARVQLLRASRAELAWALGEDGDTSPPEAASAAGSRRLLRLLPRRPGLWLLSAAALAVVFTIDLWAPQDRDAAAENDLLAVRLTSPRAGWDLFSGVHFAIEGRATTDLPCRVVARREGESDQQMTARALAANDGQPVVPIVLEAELQGPGRTMLGSIANCEGAFSSEDSRLEFELIDLRVLYDGIAPLLTVRLDEDRAREDFDWGFQRALRPIANERLGFVPEEVGSYRLQLRLRALAGADGKQAFDEPLTVALGFTLRGTVGEWSEPVDDIRARIVASRGRTEPGQPLAVAVQLRNDSDRARGYNVTGSTMAKIPQPFHFDLLIDGEAWQQRDDLGVITAAVWTFLPQPVGTMRSLIVLTDYWQREGRRPSALTGSHQVAFRFHFEPSVWNSNDRTLWMGKIDTPPIAIEFGSDR